jgi:UDP-N-acetylglucosamine 2-epimerase (non-hydrolysing)
MKKFKLLSVVGARPNFIKMAPVCRSISKHPLEFDNFLCHTGQHFDHKMSDVFFDELGLMKPDFYLNVGPGSHAMQTARIMESFESVVNRVQPDIVIVPGDVNSTLACALVACKLGVKVAHIESGLRSFDRKMPEEINRILTDTISDYLFTTEESAQVNLKNEGIDPNKVFFTGNVMIDSLVYCADRIDQSEILSKIAANEKEYVLVTFHRPSNVDSEEGLKKLTEFLNIVSLKRPVVFPIHPRTLANLIRFGLKDSLSSRIIISEPIGYFDFIRLIKGSFAVITDSGGIQEETSFLKVPCITVRESTERPVTVLKGTNFLAGTDFEKALSLFQEIEGGRCKTGEIPPLWDGKTADRIVEILIKETRE